MSSKTEKRAKEIVQLLLRDGKTSIDELGAVLKASPASIRRDLTRLEEQGLVHRTHGGAMLANAGQAVYEPFRFDSSFQVREDRFAAEKQRIARAAGSLIQENETIGIVAGTTTTLVARQLVNRKGLHIVTNAVNIGMELSSCDCLEATLTGGSMRWAGAFSLVGPGAIESLAAVVMDRLFLGVTGVDAEYGATIIEAEEAAVFRAMARRAQQIVIVADSSKMGRTSPAVVCPIADIDMIITDDGISAQTKRTFAKKGVEIIVA
jgi:DeoR family transcriptional regulator, aga operon transcriptional repressor